MSPGKSGQPAPDGVDDGSTASTPGRDSSQRFAAAAAASASAAAQSAYKRHYARLAPRSVENAEQSAVTVAKASSVAASSVIEPELARNRGRLEDIERERNDLYLRVEKQQSEMDLWLASLREVTELFEATKEKQDGLQKQLMQREETLRKCEYELEGERSAHMKTQHACSSLRENFENKLAAAERSQRILVDLEKASKQRILKEMEQANTQYRQLDEHWKNRMREVEAGAEERVADALMKMKDAQQQIADLQHQVREAKMAGAEQVRVIEAACKKQCADIEASCRETILAVENSTEKKVAEMKKDVEFKCKEEMAKLTEVNNKSHVNKIRELEEERVAKMAELSQAITRAEEGSSKLAAAEEEHSMLVKTLETKLFETQEELKRIKEEGKAALVAQGEILKQAEGDRKRELDEARRRNVAELEAKGKETEQWQQKKLKEWEKLAAEKDELLEKMKKESAAVIETSAAEAKAAAEEGQKALDRLEEERARQIKSFEGEIRALAEKAEVDAKTASAAATNHIERLQEEHAAQIRTLEADHAEATRKIESEAAQQQRELKEENAKRLERLEEEANTRYSLFEAEQQRIIADVMASAQEERDRHHDEMRDAVQKQLAAEETSAKLLSDLESKHVQDVAALKERSEMESTAAVLAADQRYSELDAACKKQIKALEESVEIERERNKREIIDVTEKFSLEGREAAASAAQRLHELEESCQKEVRALKANALEAEDRYKQAIDEVTKRMQHEMRASDAAAVQRFCDLEIACSEKIAALQLDHRKKYAELEADAQEERETLTRELERTKQELEAEKKQIWETAEAQRIKSEDSCRQRIFDMEDKCNSKIAAVEASAHDAKMQHINQIQETRAFLSSEKNEMERNILQKKLETENACQAKLITLEESWKAKYDELQSRTSNEITDLNSKLQQHTASLEQQKSFHQIIHDKHEQQITSLRAELREKENVLVEKRKELETLQICTQQAREEHLQEIAEVMEKHEKERRETALVADQRYSALEATRKSQLSELARQTLRTVSNKQREILKLTDDLKAARLSLSDKESEFRGLKADFHKCEKDLVLLRSTADGAVEAEKVSLGHATAVAEARRLQEQVGIGIIVAPLTDDGRLVANVTKGQKKRIGWMIKELIEGKAAALTGQLRPGDVILAVDGMDVHSLTTSQLTGHLLGAHGSKVQFDLLRDSSPFSVTVVRGSEREDPQIEIIRRMETSFKTRYEALQEESAQKISETEQVWKCKVDEIEARAQDQSDRQVQEAEAKDRYHTTEMKELEEKAQQRYSELEESFAAQAASLEEAHRQQMSQIQKSADEKFQNHNAKTDQMLHEVQAEKERLELRLGQLQGELEALKTQLETVHAINGTRQKQIDALTSELVEGQTTLNTKMQELHDLQISLAGEIRQMTDAHAKEIHALQESKTQLSLAFIESSQKASKEAEAALEAERTSTRLEREKAHAESIAREHACEMAMTDKLRVSEESFTQRIRALEVAAAIKEEEVREASKAALEDRNEAIRRIEAARSLERNRIEEEKVSEVLAMESTMVSRGRELEEARVSELEVKENELQELKELHRKAVAALHESRITDLQALEDSMTQKLRTAEAALEDEKTRFIQMESTWRRELNAAAGRERELKGALEIRQSDLDRAQTQVSKLTADKEDAKQHASDETAAASSHTSAADAGLVGIGVMMEPVKRNNRTIGWLVKDLTTKGAADISGQVVVGSRLLAVDGVDVRTCATKTLTNHILGTPGSEVKLSLVRPNSNEQYIARVTRPAVSLATPATSTRNTSRLWH